MQQCNLLNLPENYSLTYWMYHATSWPQLPQAAFDESTGKCVGYVLAKMEDEDSTEKGHVPHGHITSLSVLREYRKLGLATKLMRAAQHQMQTIYNAKYCSLHVRESNRGALGLYRDVLKYDTYSIAESYYADGENGLDMRLYFDKTNVPPTYAEKKAHPELYPEEMKKDEEAK